MLKGIIQMSEEITKCEKIGAWNACLVQIYAYIDALAFLDMPIEQKENTRLDYITWVDNYMKGDPGQLYQYRGKDLYGARCAVLHKFSSAAEFHSKNPDIIKFGYHDGGRHSFDPKIDTRMVILGLSSFVNDFKIAIDSMFKSHQLRIRDENERALLQSRLNQIFATTRL